MPAANGDIQHRGHLCSANGFRLSWVTAPVLPLRLLKKNTPLINNWNKNVTSMSLCFVRVQKKCAPGLPENRPYTIGYSRFLPSDQNQEGEHGQVCQSLQPQQETAVHMQVGAFSSFFFLQQDKR